MAILGCVQTQVNVRLVRNLVMGGEGTTTINVVNREMSEGSCGNYVGWDRRASVVAGISPGMAARLVKKAVATLEPAAPS